MTSPPEPNAPIGRAGAERPSLAQIMALVIQGGALRVQRDGSGWHFSAKGAFGIGALLVIILALIRIWYRAA